MAKRGKTCFDLRANLTSTKVSASHRKSTQVHASPGQTESQVDPSFQLASTCDSVWPGLYSRLRAAPAVLTQTIFRLWINTFLTGKILLLFHRNTALCSMFIFFHVKLKQPCLDQTQKRCVSEFRLRRETNLMQACSANQHQVIMPSITKSALVIKEKMPSFSANQRSVILPRMW